MELHDYLKIFKAYKETIIVFILAGMLVALLWSVFGYQGFEGSLSIIIRPSSPQETTDFQYNGFYAIEASDRVTRMVVERFKEERLPLRIKRLGNQYLLITFVKKNGADIESFRARVQNEVASFVGSLSKYPQNAFEAVTLSFSSKKRSPNIVMNTVIGLLGGLVLGFFGALFNHYRHPKR